MKFLIKRTSDSCGDKKPCKNAVKEESLSGNYYTVWSVGLDTLEDLYTLMNERRDNEDYYQTEELIITEAYDHLIGDYVPAIEIYDDLRE